MQVQFSVETLTNGKITTHFSRIVDICAGVSTPVESVVSSLHYLYSAIPHYINIKYFYE